MTISLANAPVSWGIYEFEEIAPKYPYARVMDEIRETGYLGTELGPWGFYPIDPARLGPELEKRGLRLLSAYVPVTFADASAIDQAEASALQTARLLASQGAVAVVLADNNGTVPELSQRAGKRAGESALSPTEWDVYAAGVNHVARRIFDETGLKVVFHHHCGGYVETAEEVRHLMGRVDADLVGLCLDTGHWQFAGGDALDAVREYGTRVRYLHLKDCDPVKRQQAIAQDLDYFQSTGLGVFCELGQGGVDFPALIGQMTALGYSGWAVVEQDVLVDDLDAPRASARRNREYLASIGL
jgi:inosose dehydratase